jgi:hypothetical protein
MLAQLKYFNSFQVRDMYYQCKDAPVFYFYLFPEIGAFKTFCWVKTLLNNPDYQDKNFSLKDYPFQECNKIGLQIIKEYTILPSTELWNLESLNSTINQIEYYKEAGLFKTNDDFILVVESFEKMLNHLQDQANLGCKFLPGTSDVGVKTPYNFYINEVLLGNNTIIAELDGQRISIVTYNALNYLLTKDVRFGKELLEGFQTLISRSSLISSTGEKERNKFFKVQREKVAQLKK